LIKLVSLGIPLLDSLGDPQGFFKILNEISHFPNYSIGFPLGFFGFR